MGGRMVMFGAPIMAIGLTLPLYWLLQRLLRADLRGAVAGILTSGLLLALLVAPFADMIPAMSQGPIINRRHAEALSRAKVMTPPDAMLWLWWDWGYAANHFALRQTIADGAQHAGPSLYLPAAVFATDNPRFARQIIRYTAQCGNEPGKVFEGLDGQGAQDLMDKLRSAETPLIEAKGKLYVIASFEMLRLGFWISNFGNVHIAISGLVTLGILLHSGFEGRCNANVIYNQAALFVLKHAVDTRDGLHQIVSVHWLVNIHRSQ